MSIDKLSAQSPDLTLQNVRRLAELFPECVTEGPQGSAADRGEPVIDFDLLRQALADHLVEGPQERYRLDWPGKRQALLAANAPIDKTLRPMREDSVDFDTTKNLFIEGDNLDALKLLQETYLGKVKMIYIDPPYNTGFNLIYKNDFRMPNSDYDRFEGRTDDEGAMLSSNPRSHGRFHSDWLSSFYSPVKVARNLLSDNGVLICAIDENEMASVVLLLREMFGEGSWNIDIVTVVHNPRGQQSNNLSYVNEFAIMVYPADGRKYIGDVAKEETDARNLRDSGTESDRTDAATCFYPFVVAGDQIVGIGDVPPDDFHPSAANVARRDGTLEIWPISETGDEKKWRYGRTSVERILPKLDVKGGRSSRQIIFNKDVGTMRSLWSNAKYDASEYGTKLVERLIPGAGFTFPKSLWTVFDAVKAVCEDDPNSIVIDFYAGSGTTGHALLELNATDHGSRKYILVQAPEQIDEGHETHHLGYHTIADITRARLAKAGETIVRRGSDADRQIDVGFRAFRIDSANLHDVRVSPAEATQGMLDGLVSHIKDDRSDEDLLFGALLRWGVDITLPVRRGELLGRTVWTVLPPEHEGDRAALVACFDRPRAGAGGIDVALADALASLKPLKVLFRDDGFASDDAKENVASRLRQRAPDTELRVL